MARRKHIFNHEQGSLDILIGVIPSLIFGSMSLLIAYFGGQARQQNVALTTGAGIFSLLSLTFLEATWSIKIVTIGVLAGLLWAGAQFFQLHAFRSFGVSRTMPLSTGIQLCINACAGVLFFGEWATSTARNLGICALLLIIVGIIGATWSEGNSNAISAAALRSGFLSTICCGVLFGSYPTGLRAADISAADAVGPMGIGLTIGGLALGFIIPKSPTDKVRTVKSIPMALTGGMWSIGNVIMLYSTAQVGVATGFALSQLGVVIATLGGIFLLGEKRTAKQLPVILIGTFLVVFGGALLGIAKGYDL